MCFSSLRASAGGRCQPEILFGQVESGQRYTSLEFSVWDLRALNSLLGTVEVGEAGTVFIFWQIRSLAVHSTTKSVDGRLKMEREVAFVVRSCRLLAEQLFRSLHGLCLVSTGCPSSSNKNQKRKKEAAPALHKGV